MSGEQAYHRPPPPLAALERRDGIDVWQAVLDEEAGDVVSMRAPLVIGLATLVLGVGGFVAWAATTEIAAASIAGGRIIVDGRTKTVTHLEGGTLAAVAVHEGDRVRAGDLLMTLEVTRSRARLAQLDDYVFGLKVRLGRLAAERRHAGAPAIDPALVAAAVTPERRSVLDTERRVFETRRQGLSEAAELERTTLAQLDARRSAVRARLEALRAQERILADEKTTLEGLFAKGLTVRPRVAEAQLRHGQTVAEISSAEFELAGIDEQSREARLQRTAAEAGFEREVAASEQEAQLALAQGEHERTTAADIVEKAEIRAPEPGTVAGLRTIAPGSAITPGAPLLDIVPDDQPLVVEARLAPSEIDTVTVGMPAEVHFTAYSQRTAMPVTGTVTYLAADATQDERSGESFYVLRASLDPTSLAAQPSIALTPGMSAQVYVVGQSRTAWQYLTAPVRESLRRAFRGD